MTDATAARMADACSLLSESERRFLLYQLAERRDANLEDVVTQIAAWEHDAHPIEIDKEVRQRVYVSLVHNHLPRLQDYGIIEYDLRSGDIVLDDGFEDIKPLLEQFRQTEEESEIRKLPSL
ncbi:DUF7344 domain-containing protein [Natronolimnohabitans innermongolicus]|uniref:DUF7344 domain-containing protein n=1 Tax=Natronolimnohabitans innermongolicus JCM 12255 TaxID=1227499 RepID=L9X7N2_9EURY|nr:hypothetical protein [Natronolimnohabitans innermongolicus]ELY57602.1 hypothetical protein C493_08971 [Natronolimnohabitans innermongolicus JCM 12255]